MPIHDAPGDATGQLETRARCAAKHIAANKGSAQLPSRVNTCAAEHARPVETALNGQVDPDPGAGCRKLQQVAAAHSHGAPARHIGAACPREGDPCLLQRLQATTLEEKFHNRSVGQIIEQPVRPLRSVLVHRAARRHAEAPPANAPAVLERCTQSRLENLKHFKVHFTPFSPGARI